MGDRTTGTEHGDVSDIGVVAHTRGSATRGSQSNDTHRSPALGHEPDGCRWMAQPGIDLFLNSGRSAWRFLKSICGNLFLEMHPFMQDPTNLHHVTGDAVNDVMVLHSIESAPKQDIIPLLASAEHRVVGNRVEGRFNVLPIDVELVGSPGGQSVFVDANEVGIGVRRENVFSHVLGALSVEMTFKDAFSDLLGSARGRLSAVEAFKAFAHLCGQVLALKREQLLVGGL